MVRKLFIICFSSLIPFPAISQVIESQYLKTETILKEYFTELYKSEDDQASDSLNNLISEIFGSALKNADSFNYKWDSLNMIGRLHSTDQKLNVYTWFIKQTKGNYLYYGYIQYNTGSYKKPDIRFYKLSDKFKGIQHPEMLNLSADNWLGCVYYDSYFFSYKRVNYYTLLGYNFNTDFSDKKYIEVLVFDKEGVPSFGGDFQLELQKVKRVILEYSAQLVVNIKYDEKLRLIVVDHLSPFEPMFTGNYRFYGPDGSYDGFKFQKGSFLLQKDVDARNVQ